MMNVKAKKENKAMKHIRSPCQLHAGFTAFDVKPIQDLHAGRKVDSGIRNNLSGSFRTNIKTCQSKPGFTIIIVNQNQD